jgi:hypothetical protein
MSQQFNVSPDNLRMAVDYIAASRKLSLTGGYTERWYRRDWKFRALGRLAGRLPGSVRTDAPGLANPINSRFAGLTGQLEK